jgi:hypothetical protein
MTPLYVELDTEDRAKLERLAADAGAAARRPVRLAEIIRQLVRDAAARSKPVRVGPRKGVSF